MLDRFSIHRGHFAVDTSRQHLDNFICRDLVLDSFSTPLDPSSFMFSIYKLQRDFLSFLFDLSRHKITSLSPKHFSITLFIFPPHSSVWSLHFYFSMISFLSFYHTFHAFWPNFWGFSKLMKFLWNFWYGFCLNDLKCSCIASHLHFNNDSCILDVCLLYWNDVCW